MTNNTVLFITHKKTQCGVYEFGVNTYNVIKQSTKYNFVHIECDKINDLNDAINVHNPIAIIYNYYPTVMSWVSSNVFFRLFKNNIFNNNILQIGIIHEVTQHVADSATNYRNKWIIGKSKKLINSLFDFYIAPDPTLLLKNPYVFKVGRLIPKYENNFALPQKITIGSFGFGTPNKGFENIVETVQNEFDEAIIKLNIPFAEFGDKDGNNAKQIAQNCKNIINKKNIELIITHEYLNNTEMLDFLAKNTCNVFMYQGASNRGISSVIEQAMAVQRPIAISNNSMFRHISTLKPSILLTENSLTNIIKNGFEPLKSLYNEWQEDTLVWEYERILESALRKKSQNLQIKMGIVRTVLSKFNRIFTTPNKSYTWLRNTNAISEDEMKVDTSIKYEYLQLDSKNNFNRILDNSARELYKPTINKLMEIVPNTMAKKIAEANVQQAFVFDTVYRFLDKYENPKLLCVGSYEDTASMSLIRMGYTVEEIDPMINYFLQEYISKPNVSKNSFDIIFSTSVIEHDPDDESFVSCIYELLAPNGIAVITCDFKENWKKGDSKPDVDERLYTKNDLESRLLKHMPNCELIDEPNWNCPKPDFVYGNKYHYSFATFVVRKNKV